MNEAELREYLAFAEDLARQAGKIAKKHLPDASAAVNKDDSSPVTIADEKINKLVIDAVKEKYPGIGVLGEELSFNGEKTNGLLWVCDPIDGTMPYILGMNTSTFCLALVSDGRPVVGVIYNFPNDQLFSAAKGFGATINGKKLQPIRSKPLPIVPVEWWFSASNDSSMLLRKLHELRYQTPNYTSSAYCGMQVALGNLKGLIYSGDKPWDQVATKIIFDELGYKVTDLDGNDQRYDQPIKGAIVSDGSLHKELLG